MENKVIITGTTSSGCTFLLRLFILLGFTNFDVKKIEKYSNLDLSSDINNKSYVIKNKSFAHRIAEICSKIRIDYCIIPIRRVEDSLSSNTESNSSILDNTKIMLHEHTISKLITDCIINNIPILLINFYRMISDPKYLYSKIQVILDNKITFADFLDSYAISSSLSSSKRFSDDNNESREVENSNLFLPSYDDVMVPLPSSVDKPVKKKMKILFKKEK